MGVRFQCPNGHKLHVKAELAGRRGICPECGAKFVVPSFSGQRVAEETPPPLKGRDQPSTVAGGDRAQGGSPREAIRGGIPDVANPSGANLTPRPSQTPSDSVFIPTHTPPPVAQPVAEPIATPPASANAQAEPAWYIRPAAGGQFGPASTEVFQQWIEEGRVAADSWVWRTGWADWKAGRDALALVADHPPVEPAKAMAAAAEALLCAPAAKKATPIEGASAEARRAELKRRKQRLRNISILLAVIALAMLVLLVFVLAG